MAPLASRPVSSRSLLRRRWPRFETTTRLVVSIPALDVEMAVRDLSLGGLAADGAVRFARGESYALVIQADDDPPVTIRARVAWCHGRDREERFLTGWEVLGDPLSVAAMAGLVDRYTDAGPLAAAARQPVQEHAPPPAGAGRARAGAPA